MTKETINEAGAAVPAKIESSAQDQFLTTIAKMATNKAVDTEKMQALYAIHKEMASKQAENAFNDAMNRAQLGMPRVKKNGKIAFLDKNGVERDTPFGKLEDIDKACRPIYQAEGFSVRYRSEQIMVEGGGLLVYIMVSHTGGHTEESSMRLPLDTSGSKNSLQAIGSTISYAKRYLFCMVFNIVTEGEDNDGAGADETVNTEQAAEIDNLINGLSDAHKYKPQFLTHMKVTNVLDIKARDYVKAVNAVNAKITHNKKEGK